MAAPDPSPESAIGKLIRQGADRAVSRFLRLPSPANRYKIIRGIRIPMRDGVDLLADHFIPITANDAPTVLIRSPYGRGYPWAQFYAGPLAARGFHVIVQSIRGTSGSAGRFKTAVHEADDGLDTVEWIKQQPWFTGTLATMGPSYLGMAQWALLQDPPPELAAAVILAAPHEMSAVWASGSFALDDNLRYGDPGRPAGNMILARLRYLVKGADDTGDAFSIMPITEAARAVLGPSSPHVEALIAHPDRSHSFWQPQDFGDALDRSDVPVLLITGWQDLFLDQTLEQYRRLHRRGVGVALTIGPWVHDRMLRKGASTFIAEGIDWLTSHLLEDGVTQRRSAVRIFVTNHDWIELPEWPPAMPERALTLHAGGALGDTSSSGAASPSSFLFDPAEPTPTIGGPLLMGGGYVDDTALADRPDVLTFMSERLTDDLFVVGRPRIELLHSADAQHIDVFVRVSEVTAEGQSTNVSEGYRRLVLENHTEPTQVSFELDAIAHRFPAGTRIRVIVAGGCHPRFARNTGTGEPMTTATQSVPVTHFVHHGDGEPSRLVLPAAHRPPS